MASGWVPRVSSWCFGSTSGGSISVQSPIGPSVSAGRLVLPLTRYGDDKKVAEQAVFTGYGVGLGWSIALEAPIGFALSTSKTPGGGTFAVVAGSAPKPIPASYFEGLCVIASADLVFGFMDKSSSVVLIFPTYALMLPPVAIASTLKAAGLIEGFGFTSTVSGAQAGVQAFIVSQQIDIPPLPYDQAAFQNALGNLTFAR